MSTPLRMLGRPSIDAEPRLSSYRQKKRTVTHSKIFWHKMAVSFTGVAGEPFTGFTKDQGFDCLIKGAWSDLSLAKAQVKPTETDINWSTSQIPLRAWLGNSNQVNPIVYWYPPWILQARAVIQANFTNTFAEPAGTVCFYSEKQEMRDQAGHVISIGDTPYTVTKSQTYWLFMDLSKTPAVTDSVNNDVLIKGATCNVENSAVIGRIFNETTNEAWSSEQIPLRAMAGVDGQVQPILRYGNPYLLPRSVRLRAEISATATNQYIAFLCERVYA